MNQRTKKNKKKEHGINSKVKEIKSLLDIESDDAKGDEERINEENNLDNKKEENIEQIPELNLKEKNLFYKTYKEYDSEDSYISKDSNSEGKENSEIEEQKDNNNLTNLMLDKKYGKTKDKDGISTTDNINKKQNNIDNKNNNMSIDIIKENHSEKDELINIIEKYTFMLFR